MEKSFKLERLESIPLAGIPGFSPLVKDYLLGEPQLADYYALKPEIGSFAEAIKRRSAVPVNRAILIEVLIEQYAGWCSDEALVFKQIELLAQPNTFTVTAAHQPCLLMGPMFNVFKMAGAINLSRQLKAAYPDYHFVPVFWMGSEDHDWEELGHTYVNGQRISWEAQDTNGPVGRIPMTGFDAVIAQLKVAGMNDEAKLQQLAQWANQAPHFGAFTQQLVHDWFGAEGLVVLNPDDARLKRLLVPVMIDEITNSRAKAVLAEPLAGLSRQYNLQVQPREINFFHVGKNFRKRLVLAEEKFAVVDTGVSFSREELSDQIQQHPEAFSPNVVFRPLYQEMVLPNLAFIGGAGELSYWLELKALFDWYNHPFPVLLMRPAFTLLKASVNRKIQKSGIKPLQWYQPIEATVNQFVKNQGVADLSSVRAQVEQAYTALNRIAAETDQTLTGSAEAEKQKALNSLATFEGKILKAVKRRHEEGVAQIRQVYQVMFPENSWQERVENLLTFDQTAKKIPEAILDFSDPFRNDMQWLLTD
ncbi:MAG: bacillithiol biosynthesis cysteine-adding enzyme BshC [Chitinophagales bacterium]